MICRPLREDTRHAAAAVVGMRGAYCSFQAEVVGQDTLKLGLCKREGLYHWHRQQGELRALAQTLGHPQTLSVVGAVVGALVINEQVLKAYVVQVSGIVARYALFLYHQIPGQ